MQKDYFLTQYEAAAKKRLKVSTLLIFVLIPLTIASGIKLLGDRKYMLVSFLILLYTIVPFFMVFERRKPKAREIVIIAMMSALTVLLSIFCSITVPLKAGTALVIISGIALGPEAGFLVGALSRFICNFYLGQGPWTPWQMFCWGLLGFLGGIVFNKVDMNNKIKSRNFKVIMGPVVCIIFSILAAYILFLIHPGSDKTFFGWRLYIFGFIGLIAGLCFQRKRLSVDDITLTAFTFFAVFIIYGGLINICAMVTAATIPGNEISIKTLKLLYISGAPYDAGHAVEAAIFMFLFGDKIIRKVERIKIKYGIYR